MHNNRSEGIALLPFGKFQLQIQQSLQLGLLKALLLYHACLRNCRACLMHLRKVQSTWSLQPFTGSSSLMILCAIQTAFSAVLLQWQVPVHKTPQSAAVKCNMRLNVLCNNVTFDPLWAKILRDVSVYQVFMHSNVFIKVMQTL